MIETLVSDVRKVYQTKITNTYRVNLRSYARKKMPIIFEKSIAIIIILIAWELCPRFDIIDSFLLPSFSDVIKSWVDLFFSSGELWKHFSVSLRRSAIGFAAGISIAVTLGILMGWYKDVEKILDPILQAARNSSVLALFPVFLLIFGISEVSKLAIIIWGTVWPTLLNTISGVKDVDPLLVKSARSMGITQVSLLRKVILPAAVPNIIAGVRLSGATAVMIVVAAEMIGANAGMGFYIFYMQEKYAIPQMYAGIITLSLLGVIVNYLLVKLEKRLTRWKPA